MLSKNSVDFPESKVTVGKITVKVRMSSLARRSTTNPNRDTDDANLFNKTGEDETTIQKEIKLGWFAFMHHYIPRPVIVIILHNVTVHIEKVYLAPKPSSLIQQHAKKSPRDSLPMALPLSYNGEAEDLPTFDHAYYWEMIRDEGFSGAESLTFQVERWIDHAVSKLKSKGGDKSPSIHSKRDISSPSASQRKVESTHSNVQTYDEKVNEWIKFFAEILCHFITLDLVNASVVISGAGSDYVNNVRKKYSPREANLKLAKLPKRKRALTVIGADLISLSFSPDSQCKLLGCLVGAYLKVGNPLSLATGSTAATDLRYIWHHVISPFQCIVEFKGVIPFLVFSLSYDHYWETRSFELNLSLSEKNLNLSPKHIHTVFLHLDDYTDISSPVVQWLEWLRRIRSEVLTITPAQKVAYSKTYAKIKGVKKDEAESDGDGQHLLTSTQMKELESALSQWEIMSLRCIAMRKHWLIPKENEEFAEFLRSTRSSISFTNIDSLVDDVLSPFQQVYPTPLHALFMMVWEKSSILAPHVTFTFTAGTYMFDFPSDLGEIGSQGGTEKKGIPSSLASSGVEFRFEQSNPLFQSSESIGYDKRRSFIDLSLQVAGLRWDLVTDKNDEILLELPLFRGNTPAGILYERHGVQRLESVLSIELGYSISPTKDREQHFDLSIQTSNLVVVVNPLPLLSSVHTLVELLQFPLQPQTVNDESISGESDVGGSFLSINTDVNVSVRNISFVFVVDRKKLNRGLLDFNVNKIAMELKAGGSSGQLIISTGPFSLDAARVSYHQSHLVNRLETDSYFEDNFEGIEYWLMPFKPIMLIEGVEIIATGKEETLRLEEKATETTMLRMSMKINAASFALNASPTTIVAIRGVITSFEPFLLWVQGDVDEEARIEQLQLEEKERKTIEIQRQVLSKIFKEIDVDGSGFLSDDELEQVVVMLWKEARAGFKLTDEERERETNYLVSMVDRSKSNEVSYQDLDEAVQMLSGNVDDNNLVPKNQIITGGSGDFAHSDQFLSSFQLRQLIYFEDLKEYASMHVVNEITGGIGNGTNSFPTPSLWRQGRGIDMFWELYTKETECSRISLNGQSMESVQRRLVRSLCNYEFAKFCWNSIVSPAMSSDSDAKMTNTRWLLDTNHAIIIRSGITDLLKDHVSRVTKESMEGKEATVADPTRNCQYGLSLTVAVNSASARFGSSHNFARPLLETNLTNMSLNTYALLSGDGRFVETRESNDNHSEFSGTNIIQFQGVVSAMYLNTKHSHMECFIEPYPCFGQATYQTLQGDPSMHGQSSTAVSSKSSWSVKVDCPRFFNINTSPSFFETGSILAKVIGQSDPESHRDFLYQRDLVFIHNFWDSSPALKNGSLDHDSALDVMCNAIDAHWELEFEGMPPAARRELLRNFMEQMTEENSDGLIPFEAVDVWFRNLTSRCYFTGSEEIQLQNDSGMELKVTKKSNFDRQRSRVVNEANFQIIVNSFQGIGHGNASTVSLKENNERRQFLKQSLCGNLTLYLPGFRIIENVAVNPYQTLMFKLKMLKGIYGKSNRRRSTQGVSGFKPYLTVVPKSTSLDTIALYVRSNIVIRSEIPVKVRIVRLGKSAGQFSKRGSQKRNKKSIDLTKKHLMTALNRAVEGAPIVYEHRCNGEGDVVALPVSLLVSSSFHAILIQDVSGKAKNAWRSPLLFTRDFLFNPMNIRDVSRYHTMSGVVIQKERLNVKTTGKSRYNTSAGDTKKNMTRRTAWDITILVVPSFLCMNSLPFPISVRAWQHAKKDEDDDWDGAAAALLDGPEDAVESSSSDDDDETAMSNKGVDEQYHLSTRHTSDYYHEDSVNVGGTLRLSGIDLSRPLFIEVSQHLQTAGAASLLRSSPVQIDLQKLQTGMNRKGSQSLPKLILDLGDKCDCLVDVSLDRTSKMPLCTIYSPFWLINKTGMKLEYSVVGSNDGVKSYLDSGAGGLPVLMHCSKSDETNAILDQGSRQLSVIPLESPRMEVAGNWWDEGTNGKLVLKKNVIVDGKSHVVDWCTSVNLEAAGTNGEVHCNSYVLQAHLESLAGAFHRSNLIKFTPRFIVKNSLHISISILPLAGSPRDARKMATYLRESLNESEEKSLLNLSPGESTVIYNFNNFHHAADSSYRWVAFRVNARRFGATFKCKWHMVPLDVMQSNLFGEHDGVNDTLCGIIEGKVHSSKEGSILTTISHADTPPFRIENRSQTHYLQISQDDEEADVFELPPMHSCGYTWDSPLGKRRLRVAVVPGRKSASEMNCVGKTLNSDAKSTASTIDSDDDSVEGEVPDDPLLRSLREGISTGGKNSKSPSSRQWVRSRLSRKYNLQTIGKQKDLYCPKIDADWLGSAQQNKSGECLKVHTRVSTGTKVISFSDSDWLADQVEAGLLRRGGHFMSSLIDINMEGAGIFFNDNFPRELMGIFVRDIQICKPMGSIETTTRVRHFQIDAMLPNARYPIIIQPLPLGVDRRMQEIPNSSSNMTIIPRSIKTRECYWKLYDEKPVPLFEMKCSYVPQNKMVWVPSLEVQLSPMKLQMDVDYILRVLSLIFDSVSKYRKEDIGGNQAIMHVNEDLSYITRGSMNICLTYIENFYIHPVEIQLEINIKSDEEDFNDGEYTGGTSSSLTLHTISQSTNSEWVAGVMGWLINVGANFAHVSPTYTYTEVRYTDTYSDIIDLIGDVLKFYVMKTIKQCYKVVFSMHLLGDPSLLLHQWKTGVKDLFVKTAEEIAAGGKDGVGKGVSSLVQNVVGGTFFAAGRVTGSLADTITAVTTTDLSSEKLKPKSASSDGRNPDHAVDGLVQGTGYLTQTVAHGIAGLIGNPYRGAKTGTVSGVAKGVTTGVVGVLTMPLVGALGFIAKTSTGIGQTSKMLDLGCIEARCRPRRVVPWGMPMSTNEIPYLKGIGIRIHTVRYQKVRKRAVNVDVDGEHDGDDVSTRERRRILAAEKRRLDPPLKQVSIKHQKDKRHRLSFPIRPKLLADHPGNLVLSHYAVTFEETIELRSSDLQLDDIVTINFWNHKTLKHTPKAKVLAVCNISVGDMYSHALTFHLEQLKRVESNLARGALPTHHHHDDQSTDMSLVLPAPQEFPLFRPLTKSKSDRKDIFEAISEEIVAIGKTEEDRVAMFASDSDAESDSSLAGGKKTDDEGTEDLVSRNERLFGNVSLSFFPIPW